MILTLFENSIKFGKYKIDDAFINIYITPAIVVTPSSNTTESVNFLKLSKEIFNRAREKQ